MNKFSDFNIKPEEHGFIGTKIDVNQVFDTDITVVDFKIKPSLFPKKENDKCLHLQIKIGEQPFVIFTPAKGLMSTLERIPKPDGFPFAAKIIKNKGRLEFK